MQNNHMRFAMRGGAPLLQDRTYSCFGGQVMMGIGQHWTLCHGRGLPLTQIQTVRSTEVMVSGLREVPIRDNSVSVGTVNPGYARLCEVPPHALQVLRWWTHLTGSWRDADGHKSCCGPV